VSAEPQAAAPVAGTGAVEREAGRRRTFAIISHPDAGKTTLTEKLLLYGGALQEAGQVQGKGARRQSTSDWMDIERRRGISVTSTVLRFEYGGVVLNLLDTPGHHDFSEDTLRVLAAADAAVLLLDAAKGVEAQTLRLFEVARARQIPLLTFVNKYDRPGLEPLEMLDHITAVLGLEPVAMTWPVGIPGDFRGVVDRAGGGGFVRFTRTVGGATQAPEEHLEPEAALAREGDEWATAVEELELVEAVSGDLDPERFATGASSRSTSARRSRTSASACSWTRWSPWLRLRARAPTSRASRARWTRRSPRRSSRSRRTWIRAIVTGSPSCGSGPGASSAACARSTPGPASRSRSPTRMRSSGTSGRCSTRRSPAT